MQGSAVRILFNFVTTNQSHRTIENRYQKPMRDNAESNSPKRNTLLFFIGLCTLTSCDPVHILHLENKTGNIIFVQTARAGQQDTLAPGTSIKIGKCVARYNPNPSDIEPDYLRVISKSDTATLIGKTAIFSMIQKVEKLNWRIIIREK